MCDQKCARCLPLPTSAKQAVKREKRHGNRKKVVLVNKGMGVHVTNPPGLGGKISSEVGPGRDPLEAGFQPSIDFGRGWIRLLSNSQPVCKDLELKHVDAVSRGVLCYHCPGCPGPVDKARPWHLSQALNQFETSPAKSCSFLDKPPLSQLVPPAGYHSSSLLFLRLFTSALLLSVQNSQDRYPLIYSA